MRTITARFNETTIKSNTEYHFEKDVYQVYQDNLTKKMLYIPNNDSGVKTIAIYLTNEENIVLDFGGSTLVFHGRISPFIMENCKNITIKNCRIDYDRPFYTQGKILTVTETEAEIDIDKSLFPYRIEDEKLVAYGKYWEQRLNEGINLMLEFDEVKKSPAYNAQLKIALFGKDAIVNPEAPLPQTIYSVYENEKGNLVIRGDVKHLSVGNVLVITHEERQNSLFYFNDCENIVLQNIDMITSGSMGVICKTTGNVLIDNVRCTVFPESKGFVSTNCDATHFVNCYGLIEIKNCLFENMMDDGTNIHGIFTLVDSVCGQKMVVSLRHFQQVGNNIFANNDKIKVLSADLHTFDKTFTVSNVKMLDEKHIELTVKESTVGVEEGFIVDNDKYPEVYIHDCKTGNNRPRGFLIGTNKKVVISNNEFYNSDCAICSYGDTVYWFESTGIQDVIIENNLFNECNYHTGEYPIIVTGAFTSGNVLHYGGGLKVLNNKFVTFTGGVAYMKLLSDAVFKNNKIVEGNTYKQRFDVIPIYAEKVGTLDIDN